MDACSRERANTPVRLVLALGGEVHHGRSPLAGGGPLPAQDVLAHGGHGVPDSAPNLDETRPGAIKPRLGQPRVGDAEQLGDLRRVVT
jgi:hypothetical protein